MTLIVHTLGAYASYSYDEHEWRREDYDINKFVKSLKGENFTGYANMRDVNGINRRIIDSDPSAALAYFAAWGAQLINDMAAGGIVLVPVPSSQCVSHEAVSTPYTMANALQAIVGNHVRVERWLCFAQSMTPSHAGGTRDSNTLASAMRVAPASRGESHVILVDDVMTTGGHLKACASVLRDRGVCVDAAIVAARTVWAPHETPLQIAVEDLDG